MAKRKSIVVALTMLAVVCFVAIAIVIWRAPGRPTATGGTGISAVAGGISWLELYLIAGGGLAICFALAGCVALLMRKRMIPESGEEKIR